MLYFDLIEAELVLITVATVVSIILVLLVTGLLHQYLHSRSKKHHIIKPELERDGND